MQFDNYRVLTCGIIQKVTATNILKRVCFAFGIFCFLVCCKDSANQKDLSFNNIQNAVKYQKLGFSFECVQKLNEQNSSLNGDSTAWLEFETLNAYVEVKNLENSFHLFKNDSPSIYKDYCDLLEFDSLAFVGSHSEYLNTIIVEGIDFVVSNEDIVFIILISPNLLCGKYCVIELSGSRNSYYDILEILSSFTQEEDCG